MSTNFSDSIKMVEESDEWQEHFGNDDMHFDDAAQIFPEALNSGGGGSGDGSGRGNDPEIIYVYIDIQSPIHTLKVLLQEKTKKDLSDYNVCLQNMQMLEPSQTLVDKCEKANGLVRVNAQIFDGPKRINIADVVKPTEEVGNVMKSVEETDSDIVMNEKKNARVSGKPVKSTKKNQGNGTGNNGQIQLWYVNIIN